MPISKTASKSQQVGVQIPCGVYTEVPEEDAVRNAEKVSGGGVSAVGPAEGEPDFGRAFDAGSRSHVDCDPAEMRGVASDRLHQGQERNPSCQGLWREEAQLRGPELLGKGVFCVDGWAG